MKVLIVAFVLYSLASSQTQPINGTSDKSDSQHANFRKCIWERCSFHGCNSSYILSDEFLKYDDEKLGMGVLQEWHCYWATLCHYNTSNPICGYYFYRGIPPPSYSRQILRYIVWIIGFLVIAGNAYVIVRSFVRTSCFKQAWPSASLQCNHIVVLNIAVADFIVGIYLITISIIIVVIDNNEEWIASLGCAILGSLVVISSEASCFLMVILTSFRLFHVYRPLSSVTASSWSWKICIVISWSVAVFWGIFPILENSEYFVQYYVMENALGNTVIVHKTLVKNFIFTVVGLYRSNYTYEFLPEMHYTKKYFPKYVSQNQFERSSITNFTDQDFKIQRDIIKLVGDFYLNYIPKGKLGYYSNTEFCLPRLFIRISSSGWEYSIALLTLNLICFVFIAVSYILIYIRSINNRPINAVSTLDLQKRETKMQKRIARIIITDFVCWVPICIIGFVAFGGLHRIDDIINEISIGFLLPINSVLNPFLYSVSVSRLFKKLGCRPTARYRN